MDGYRGLYNIIDGFRWNSTLVNPPEHFKYGMKSLAQNMTEE